MRIKELLSEAGTGSLRAGVKHSLPNTFVLPDLENQDAYRQYRMGVALAGARAVEQGLINPPETESTFGEQMTIVNYSEEDKKTMELALKLIPGYSAKKQISTSKSEESRTVQTVSPIAKRS